MAAAVWSMLDPHLLLSAVRDEADQLTDLMVVDANEAACSAFGLGRDELLGAFLGELHGAVGRWSLFTGCMETMRTGRSLIADDAPYLQPGDSRELRLDVRAVRIGGDRVSVTWRDVTARYEAARELERQRALLRATLDSELDPQIVMSAVRDGAGRIVDFQYVAANPVALTYLGVSEQQFVGMRLREMYPSDAAPVLLSMYAHTVTTGEPLVADDFAYPNELFGGEERRYDLRGARLGDGISLTWRDVTERHRDRMALAESEARFRNAMASASIGMCMVHPDGTFLQVNQSLCDLLGRDESTLLTATWQELTHPDDLAGDLELVRQVLAGSRESYRLRKRFLRPDGAAVHGDLSVGCVRDPAGAVRYLVSQIVDVTRQVHAEEALAASRDEYRLLAEHATDVVYRTDGQGVITWVSDSVTRVLGYRPEQVIGHSGWEFIDPEDRQAADFVLQHTGSEDLELLLRLFAADGSSRWARAVAHQVRDADGAVQGVVGGWQDIDAEHRAILAQLEAQAALAASEARFRMLAENSSDVIVQVDGGGVMRWLSPSVREVSGFRPEELLGQPISQYVHDDDLEGFRNAWAEAVTGAGLSFRARLRRRDCSYLWVAAVGRPAPRDSASPGDMVLQLRDIAAEVAARQELQQSFERLGEALEVQADPQAIHEAVRNEAGRVVDMRFVAANAAMCRHLGKPREQLLGRLLTEVQPQTDPRQMAQYAKVIETGTPLEWNEVELDSAATGEHQIVDFRCYKVGDGVSMAFRDVTFRAQTMRALARAEARYRSLARSAAVGLIVVQADGRIAETNDAACELTGWDRRALLTANWADITHPDERAEDLMLLDQLVAGDRDAFRRATRLVRGDDEVVWVDLSVAAVRSREGDFSYLIAQIVDITEAVAAQDELAASEQRYRMLAENVADVILQVGDDGRVWWASPSVAQSLGWPAEELVGRSLADLVHPGWADEVRALAGPPGGRAGAGELTLLVRRGDGSDQWMQLRATEVPAQGNRPAFQVVRLRDAHAEVQARRELAAERALLADTLDAMIDPHLILQPLRSGAGEVDMVCLQANPAAAEYLGVPRGDLVGHGLLEVLDGPAHKLVSLCAQVAETGESLMLEAIPFRAAGSESDLFITVRITRVGQVVAANWSDVTDAHLAASRLAESEVRYRLLADHSGDVVVSTDPFGRLTYVSPAISTVLGWRPEELVGTSMGDLVHPDDLPAARSFGQQILGTDDHAGTARARLRRADGTYTWISSVGRAVTDDTGVQTGVVATWRDVQAVVAAEEQTESERSRLAAVLDSELEPHVYLEAVRDSAGEIVDFIYRDVNDAARDFLQNPEVSLEGARLTATSAGTTGPSMLAVYAAAVASGEPLVLDDFAVPEDGPAGRRFDIRAVRVGDGLSLAWRDVTDRFRDAQGLVESRQQYRLLAENATDAVFRADRRGILAFVTPGVTSILGLTPEQVVGRSLIDLVHPDDRVQLAVDLPDQQGSWPRRVRMLHASGGLVWVEMNATGVSDAGDAAIVGGWHDVTAEVAALESLRKQARTDGLTGLLNRAEAISRLAHILGHAPRSGRQVATLFCDLDGLKQANDSHGHAAGNTLITAAAQRIQASVRESDLVARFGGDEFLVVLTGISSNAEALAVAEKIRSAIEQPVEDDGGRPLATTISIGVAMATPGDDVDSLVARADAAMYAAKRAGGDAVQAAVALA